MTMLKQAIGWMLLIGLGLGMLNSYTKPTATTPATAQSKPAQSKPAQSKPDGKSLLDRVGDKFMEEVNGRALSDAMADLTFVVNNGGSFAELCVRAGIVSALLVQVRAESQYREMRKFETGFCKAAMEGKTR